MTIADACVLFDGAIRRSGYGQLGGGRLAHRVAWEHEHGPIATGMHVHHKCGNRSCVNLDHLELLTAGEHMSLHHRRTHCRNGHLLTPENTISDGRTRRCAICRRRTAAARARARQDACPDCGRPKTAVSERCNPCNALYRAREKLKAAAT